MASSAPCSPGLLWQTGAVAAPLVVKYAIDHGIVPRDHAALLVWLFVVLAVGLLEVCARRLPPLLYAIRNRAAPSRRPRRALRPRAAARRDLPRPRRPGRAAEPRLVRLAAHRADDGRDRPHDRLRPDVVARRDRDARPRLAARARGADPGAVRDASAPGSTRASTTRAPASCRRAGRRRSTLVEETVSGIRVVKGLGAGDALAARFRGRSDRDHRTARSALARLDAVFIPVLEMLPLLGIAAVLWLGGRSVINGRPHRRLVRRLQRLRGDARLAAARARPARDDAAEGARGRAAGSPRCSRPSRSSGSRDTRSSSTAQGDIRLDGVRFGHEGDRFVLDGLDLHVAPGESLALVGATGSGKSTVAACSPGSTTPRRAACCSTARPARAADRRRPPRGRARLRGDVPVQRERAREHPPRPAGRERRGRRARRRARRCARVRATTCPTATRRCSASAASRSRAASGSGSRSRARSSPTRPCSSSTTRPRPSTRPRSTRSARRWPR